MLPKLKPVPADPSGGKGSGKKNPEKSPPRSGDSTAEPRSNVPRVEPCPGQEPGKDVEFGPKPLGLPDYFPQSTDRLIQVIGTLNKARGCGLRYLGIRRIREEHAKDTVVKTRAIFLDKTG